MKAFTLLLAVLLAGPCIAQDRGPIIDMHLHAFGFDEYGNPPPPNEVTGQVPTARSDEAAIRATLDEMQKHNVVLAVASGPLADVQRWKTAGSGRLIGGAYTGPRDPLPDIASLRRLIQEKKIAVLGELGLQYRGLSPEDPLVAPYFALAEELDIPVAVHTGLGDAGTPYNCCPSFRTSLGNPQAMEEVLFRHPKLRVSLMHAGYPYLAETKAILYIYPQVYVDIAVLNWALPRAEFHSYLKALIDAGFGKRIMFGSDQMIWPDAIGQAIAGVDDAPFLSPEQKRDIFYNNAANFLRLDQGAIDRHHSK
jgi:predicted TIM-barrel fold metal-dependent hydrolase